MYKNSGKKQVDDIEKNSVKGQAFFFMLIFFSFSLITIVRCSE